MTIDTNELRQLAQEAMHPVTKGRWMRLFGERTVYDRMEDGCRGIPVVSTPFSPPHPFEAACLDFIAAANPAAAIELLDRLEVAEKTNREWLRANAPGGWIDNLRIENEALRAKIAEMEKQEPAGFLDGYGRAILQRKLHPWADLYALPGAQPQLNEVKIALQRALELGQRETWTGARKHRSREDQREEQQCWNKVWSLLGAQGERK